MMAGVFFLWFRSSLAFLSGNRKSAPALARAAFFMNITWRFPAAAQYDRLYGIRILKFCLGHLWRSTLHTAATSSESMIGGSKGEESFRRQFLAATTGRTDYSYFSREDFHGGWNTTQRLGMTFILCLTAFCNLPWYLFSARRNHHALALVAAFEQYNLLRHLKNSKTRKVYLFNIYENESNLTALLLQQHGIEVHKITSDVPLSFANRIILADYIHCCIPLQMEELQQYRDTIRCREHDVWGPEHLVRFSQAYRLPEQYDTPPHTIGYYSSGGWVRASEGHPDLDTRLDRMEELLEKALAAYLRARPHVKLMVFAHPQEKKSAENYEQAEAHYAMRFAGIMYELRPRDSVTWKEFHTVDVAVSANSTISFERLGMGFKSLICPQGMDTILPDGTALRRMSALSAEELFTKLDSALAASRTEFFAALGLAGTEKVEEKEWYRNKTISSL